MKKAMIFLSLLFVGSLVSVSGASAAWKNACEKKRCQLFTEVVKQNGGALARLYFQNIPATANHRKGQKSVTKRGKKKKTNIVGIAGLPLGLYIPAGVSIKIDDKMTFKAELIECRVKEGCRAAFNLQPATLDAMKHGANIYLIIADGRSRRTLTFKMSLKGFTAAYKKFVRKL